MKVLKYIGKAAWTLPAIFLMAGCAGDDALLVEPDADITVPDEITLSLSVPDEVEVNLGTRASDSSLGSFTVMCFDSSGKGLQTKTYSTGWSSTNDGFEMTVGLHKNTSSIQVVANADIADNDSGVSDPSEYFTSDPAAGVLWGRADLSFLIASGAQMTLVRQNAKVSVTNSASGFTLSGYGVYGTASQGSLAPAAGNYSISEVGTKQGVTISNPTVKSSESYAFSSGAANSTGEIAIFESAATTTNSAAKNCARVIVRGTYNGTEYFYPVAFRTRSGSGYSEEEGAYTYTNIPILRNHHYKIQILEVRGEGWTSFSAACIAEPENRMTVLITDVDDSITDITSTRDYLLGIGGDITVDYDGTAIVNVLTNYSGTATPTITADESWVLTGSMSVGTPTSVSGMTSGTNSSGVKYTVTLPLQANDKSTEARTANVTVRVADLTRTFVLTQQGRDYKRDSQRPVVLEGLGTTVSNYFDWIDNTCQGLLPDQNRGVVRNEGLHFPAVPGYTASYKVTKLSGDQSATTSGNFTVSTSGNYYVVTCSNASTTSIETGTLTVVNADGAKIEYPLYKTGYFHQLTSAMDDYMREDEKVNGWFYYEVVKVGSYYIMDRNLGASTNAPYISTYAGFSGNKGAIGAYFKIATAKSSSESNPNTIISKLGVSNWKIPTRDEVKNGWGIKVANVSGTTGETSRVATVTVTGSLVADSQVFIPHGGYYDGTSAKYETHANVWTRTLLSGNQGFSTASPEFGYWYLFLDVYGTSISFSNMRFCNGASGSEPTDDSVYKYMPLRLTWNN